MGESYISCLLLCFLFNQVTGQTNYLSFWIPEEITYGETVYITCKPNDAGKTYFSVVSSVQIYRQRENEEMKLIVKASYASTTTSTNVEWFDRSLEQKGKVTSTLGPPETSMFRLRLDDVDCTDQGLYKCVVRDEATTGNEAVKMRTSIVNSKSPGVYPISTTYVSGAQNMDISQLAVLAAIRDLQYTTQTAYPLGSVGLFKCVAALGFPAPKLRWCIKRPTSSNFQTFDFVSVQRKFPANTSISAQACLYSSSDILLFPIRDSDNGTILSCSVSDEECGTVPPSPPISNPDKLVASLAMSESQSKNEREIVLYIGEDETHVGVNAEENRAIQIEKSSDDSTMVVLGIAMTVMFVGIVLLTMAVVTYFKAKKTNEVGKIKASAGNQYTDLEMRRRVESVHSEVYTAIENLPPDLPTTGKPYEVDDMYMLPVN
ncbi:uncharacterized protein LOC133173892 [Saccostrea echinata]|uniref:uncharacterized protein LOC133173892 n=1 Tax=Saccostrea echinata TaxID=191078 RepID=UPI002A810B5F|nr:uncharacterized protein LOC133173892 [Saccostrea echinata]